MKGIVLAALLVSTTVGTPIAAYPPDNEVPLADAGLDQTVSLGTTVLLDATGSRDPDGAIDEYRWRITTPNGSVTTPSCADCSRTDFMPSETGTYAVRVAITDDSGATSNDTLYVNVTPGDSPSVSLSGPDALDVGADGDYSARVRRGGAPLDRVRWKVDGTVVRTRSLSDDEQMTFERSFGTTGDRTVSAVVIDESGRRDTSTITTEIERSTRPRPNPAEPDQPDPAPVLRGPEVLTGTEPFTGNYTVETRRSPSYVDEVRWNRDGVDEGAARELAVDWEPGRHSLSPTVTYSDGKRTEARFENGRSSVVVDARPTASFRKIDNGSTLSGIVNASDANGNLQQVYIDVNGRTVREWDARDSTSFGRIYERHILFRERDVSLGSTENVTLVAVDARGQRFETTRNVTPRADPEIVSAEFVNGPVDSYHDRIEAERYAAHHVLKIDLDGMSPGDVRVSTDTFSANVTEIDTIAFNKHREYDKRNDTLTVHTYWSGKSPDNYTVYSDMRVLGTTQANHDSESVSSTFSVTPSPPEIRIDIMHGGYFDHIKDYGKVIDARRSFDPDGTKLRFRWGQGAQKTTTKGIGKLDSFKFANLTVRDDFDLESEIPHNFAHYYTPDVRRVREVSDGPYDMGDSVRYEVYSDRFQFTKNLFHERHDVDVTASHGVQLLKLDTNEIDKRRAETDPDIDKSGEQYVATVEVKARALTEDKPAPDVVFYNPVNPDMTRKTVSLRTDSQILAPAKWRRTNMTIEDLSYVVSIPYRSQRTVSSAELRDQLLNDGYRLDGRDVTGSEYVVEERKQVKEAQYEKETKWFPSRTGRSQFLEIHDDWTLGERSVEQETRISTETEWRNSHGGRGEYTGETRRVQTEPAQYRTQRKYRYSTRVERTRTVTETHTTTVPDPDGWGTIEHTYETTSEESYTETVKRSYWSTSSRNPSHIFTGATRRIQNSPARYTTQYQYSYRTEQVENIVRYSATRRVQTQSAEYKWKTRETLSNKATADQMARTSPDVRIGGRQPTKEWILSKQTGVRNITIPDYNDPNNVVRTEARVSGVVARIYEQINGDDRHQEYIRDFTKNYSGQGIVTPRTIKDDLQTIGEEKDPCLPNVQQRCNV